MFPFLYNFPTAIELGPRNFATRIRPKAIGSLGALIDTRERRDAIEAYYCRHSSAIFTRLAECSRLVHLSFISFIYL